MPLNLASPGIVVKEVDLTLGRVSPSQNITAALVGPFAQGPVEEPTLVENENDLLKIFGQSYTVDKQYETWLTASSYLAYGGNLRIVRADDTQLRNAGVGTTTTIKIKSLEHYTQLGYDENIIPGVTFVARNPGSWGNGIKVAMIDGRADQILSGINTSSVYNFTSLHSEDGNVGVGYTDIITGISSVSVALGSTVYEVRSSLLGLVSAGTTVLDYAFKNGNYNNVLISNPVLINIGLSDIPFQFGITQLVSGPIQVGYGITQSLSGKTDTIAGTATTLTGYSLKGIVTGIGNSLVEVKILSRISPTGDEVNFDYQQNGVYSFVESGSVAIHTSGQSTPYGTGSYSSETDWFDSQTISSVLNWNNIAPKPGTTAYADARGSRFDEVHVVVIDDLGTVTGNAGTILEKHIGLSKGTDAQFSVGSPSYWRKYLSENSNYIFGGGAPVGLTTTGFDSGEFDLTADNGWDQNVDGIIFGSAGSNVYTLSGGLNYDGNAGITTDGALNADLSAIKDGYDLFENTENFKVNYLLMGSANHTKETAQELANKIISVAELRKDAVAFISPYRGAALTDTYSQTAVNVNSAEEITSNVLSFFSSVASTTYAVFDSGYKYMYDRFSNTFRYVPLNGDIAGLCARTDINNFPWFSPAGTSRGAILNAVKLPYNPSKSQRDRLYSNRINPVIFSPGSGIILFGDRTGYGKASAFDRINVRRLFLYLEDAISFAARDQLFEFNDEVTRTNFVNTIEPFLRDVQAKRGVFDYVVVCDETNNTAAVIDNNEFVADIYIKPTRSINFIGLTFIATKTGVDFQEVIGNF